MKEKTIDEDFYIDGSLALQHEENYNEQTIKGIYVKYVKRIMDILLSFFGLIIVSPVFCIIAIAIKLDSKGSIFYSQERIGKNGKIFKMYKFRTMICNSDEVLKELLKDDKYKKEWSLYQKFEKDPRITKVGNILRKTSLDELPQFINILKGDMSLIGPRPLVKGELDLHNGNHSVYESVRPGLTSWWAVNGRSNITYKDRLELEYYYIKNISLLLDIKCILKTIMVVIRKSGAK